MELLADKIRPTKLDDIIGQSHLVGKGKVLRNLVDNKKIFGYYGEHKSPTNVMLKAYYKYNKETQEYVVYAYSSDGQPKTITYFRIPWSQYNGDKALQYVDEIEPGK